MDILSYIYVIYYDYIYDAPPTFLWPDIVGISHAKEHLLASSLRKAQQD